MERGELRLGPVDPKNEYSIELDDHRILDFHCKEGHRNLVMLQVMRFELLFDIGLYALKDGYPDASILRHAAARERFFEYAMRVMWAERNGSQTKFGATWGFIRKRSELQKGGFLMVGLFDQIHNEFLEDVKDLEKGTDLRNNVAHHGYFPTYSKAEDYARSTYNFISKYLLILKENYANGVQSQTFQEMNEISTYAQSLLDDDETGTPISTSYMPTELGVARSLSEPVPSFDEVISKRPSNFVLQPGSTD